jgi:hypothetical protein
VKEIPLTKGYVALVDDEDYEWLSRWKWFAKADHNLVYARRMSHVGEGKRTTIGMHRLIMGDPPGREVDHWDNDGCNNQRGNLRVATHRQNLAKSRQVLGPSGFRGVSWDKERRKWRARIHIDGKEKTLGRFRNADEAARAYDAAAKEVYGEFALTNGLD